MTVLPVCDPFGWASNSWLLARFQTVQYTLQTTLGFLSLLGQPRTNTQKKLMKTYGNIWATDEITCLGNMPSPKVGGPLSVLKVLWFATSTSKQNHTIYIVASWDLHMFRKMQIWFCSLFLFTTLTTSAHENINPRGETLKLETRDSTKHPLGPTKRSKQQTMNLELWSKTSFVIFPLGHGLAGAQNLTNWVSVGIGWGIGGSCL